MTVAGGLKGPAYTGTGLGRRPEGLSVPSTEVTVEGVQRRQVAECISWVLATEAETRAEGAQWRWLR